MEDQNKSDQPEVKQSPGVKDKMYWWLNYRRAFYIGDEYKIELEAIDTGNKSVKILVTNLKNNAKEIEIVDTNLDLINILLASSFEG